MHCQFFQTKSKSVLERIQLAAHFLFQKKKYVYVYQKFTYTQYI